MKTALVLGAGGFIGWHLTSRLKSEGYYVVGVDLKHHEFANSTADKFIIGDLRDRNFVAQVVTPDVDEIYQLAADMGGAGYIFTGDNDADVMHNSASINLNVLDAMVKTGVRKVFYSSSACIYPGYNQTDPQNPSCSENSVYPAMPDSEYGWEKLFSERLYLSYFRNYGIDVKIARFHNIFGTMGAWTGGKEKAPAALCRKVAKASLNGEIEIWGSGEQTRSCLYVDGCIDGVRKLMTSNHHGPYNIGSEEMVTINELAGLIMSIANKSLTVKHVTGPLGVMGRNSDNKLIWKDLNWKPSSKLKDGLSKTYRWIEQQVLESVPNEDNSNP